MIPLGEIKNSNELGFKDKYNKYIWHACIDCGKERWVMLVNGKPRSLRCQSYLKRGQLNPTWKGGRYKDKNGYVQVKLQPDDFFFPLVGKSGYALEHRIVMAKHLGRNLQLGRSCITGII